MSMLEEELYTPVKKYFERKGFEIKGEIKDCDIVGINGETILIVELKRTFSLKLIYQAMERQKITDLVYVAIPRPKSFKPKEISPMLNLLKKINIGLIVVSFGTKRTIVQIISNPSLKNKKEKINYSRRNDVLYEFKERKGDFNIGGKNKTKIVTAYREKSIEIACFLELLGKSGGANLKKLGCDKNSTSIMYNNFYGWFSKISKGIYTLTEKGENYLNGEECVDIIEFYRKEAKKNVQNIKK